MPVGYHINDDEGLITLRVQGDVALEQIEGLGRQLLGDTAYDPALPQLIDCRGMRPMRGEQVSAEFLDFVQSEYGHAVRASVAVVVDDDLEAEPCAGAYLVTCAMGRAEMFEDYDQALGWLVRREFAPLGALLQQQNAAGHHSHRSPE